MERVRKEFEDWYNKFPEEVEMTSKEYTELGWRAGWEAAENSMHLTGVKIIAACGLCCIVGFVIIFVLSY